METNDKIKDSVEESQLQLYLLSKRFFKLFSILFIGYVLGWFGLSIAWLMIGVFVWTLRYKYFKEQSKRVKLLRGIASDEKLAITCAVKDLPSWVYFPDTERAEWLNKILKQMWPFVDEYVKTLIKQSIEPNITSSLPDFLKSFRFEKVDLGTVPVRIGSVKCYDENTARDEIMLDIEVIYAGNCDIQTRIKGMKAGIKDFQLYGIVRVELRPLLKDIPLVGCVSFYFLNSPSIEFNLTNLADILDIPGLSDYLRRAIKEQLDALMVLPNKYVFPLINDLSMKSIKFLQPIGAVRIEVIEARNLKKSDVGMLGMGKSDPYVRIIIGNQEFRSKVIYNTVNPKWNYICEVVVHHLHAQDIELEVMDEDQGSKDDFLGRTSISLNTISNEGLSEAWLTLKDTKTGALHVRTTWFAFSDCIDHLNDKIIESKTIKSEYESTFESDERDSAPFGSVAAILVYLDCARNLPVFTKTAGDPDPYCIITIGNQKRHSIVRNCTANPVWEETFNFLVDNLSQNLELNLEVIDSKSNKQLGSAELSLQEITSLEDLSFNQPLPIKGRGTECQIHVNVVIKILKTQLVSRKSKHEIEGPKEERVESSIPTLEDLIKGTVQPIIDTSGLKQNVIEKSQNDRKHTHIKANGSNKEENSKEEELKESSDYPKIQITLQKKLNSDNKLELILHKAENLPKIGDKEPDPYVKIYQMPDKTSRTFRDNKIRSEVKRNTCNPIFDENFELKTDPEWNGLEIVVYSRLSSSHIFKKKNKIIGLTSIDLQHFQPFSKKWYDLEQIND